ncbi:heme exporter protein CcmB [Bordetella parapertussis]|uniref:Heme exporter protein B n=3 Tax=Bordetella TaxID=517 RepID=Q7W737_BORPA|nr:MULTISPECIES: heme exporter protein CcmB [Bordetella]KAK69266.1 heme exporter protein CcmB [Bordetella bronchiseptica 980-2]KCV31860.1 heme exporter protein CcmB [Bordetella bronchiseptica 00-P-2730]KDD53188.1 heme exporter protein CcmB [Bordetella bronchiseptica OSU553]SHS34491.1 Cytochrome c-type biogenesis protein CcmB [Mycobacteroides abscessus subsp. abscessus]AMG89013.1 heme exporter protein CcmB [Bordetella bronchiseptica]
MLKSLAQIAWRELRLAWRRPADTLGATLFFVVAGTLFPLALGPDPQLLAAIGPGVLWVSALLAILLSLQQPFVHDHGSGALEQLLVSPHPLPVLVGLKLAAHWLATCAPLILASPFLALQFGLSAQAVGVLALSLLLGTPTLALIGGLGAALTLGLRGGALLPLVVLPLYVPVLIFGSGAVAATASGLGAWPQLSLLGACLCLAILLCPWSASAALRVALE